VQSVRSLGIAKCRGHGAARIFGKNASVFLVTFGQMESPPSPLPSPPGEGTGWSMADSGVPEAVGEAARGG